MTLPSPAKRRRHARDMNRLPRPRMTRSGQCQAQWASVLVFFNMPADAVAKASGYKPTTVADAKVMLDEGLGAMSPGVSEYTCRHWHQLSQGAFAFSVNTVRKKNGDPKVLTLDVAPDKVGKWSHIVRVAVDAAAEDMWKAAGKHMLDGKRWIPSVMLVQNWNVGANAHFAPFERSVGGKTYVVGDEARIRFSTTTHTPKGASSPAGRLYWKVLMHEYAHNFLEYGDLYGPQGSVLYWDLLGDASYPGHASEVSSRFKADAGWISFKKVLEGPTKPVTLSLAPYTTSGEAIKIVPDPQNTPDEYFLLEYRRSTGPEAWRPDGDLAQPGLMITHVNENLEIASVWQARGAPTMDPEFADFSDKGLAWRANKKTTNGKLFGPHVNDAFTPTSSPNSNLYGGRRSGLHVTDINPTQNGVTFKIMVAGTQKQVGWAHGAGERATVGRMLSTSPDHGEDVLLRRGSNIAVLENRQATWQVRTAAAGKVGAFSLAADDREVIADFDGDGLDEIFVYRPNGAAMLEYDGFKLDARARYRRRPGGDWELGKHDRMLAGDFDHDGKAELFFTSPKAVAMLDYFACAAGSDCSKDTSLTTATMQHKVGSWNPSSTDRHYVGRFRFSDHDQVLVIRNGKIGLMQWDHWKKKLVLATAQSNVGGVSIEPNDSLAFGDFDGDGLDEIFVHRGDSVAVLEWGKPEKFGRRIINDELVLKWKGTIDGQTLAASDQVHGARVRQDRDGVLLRTKSEVRVLRWDDGAKAMVQAERGVKRNGKLDRLLSWNMSDAWVVGDFDGQGNDPVDTAKDYVIDGIDDVFVHGAWGTATISLNPLLAATGKDSNQVGLSWYRLGTLMRGG